MRCQIECRKETRDYLALMKLSLLVIILLSFHSFFVNAQTPIITVYDKLGANGVDITEGWHYTDKDDPNFAAVGANENKWLPIDPTKALHQLPELRNVKVGWMRTHFKVSPEIGGKTLLMSLFQNCGSEIYLDGKLVKRYGVVSADPARVVPIGVNLFPEEIRLSGDREHVIAVRFSPWEFGFKLKMDGYFFWLAVNDLAGTQASTSMINTGNNVYIVLSSIFFLLSLFHLSFYRYDPKQRANLFFSLYAIVSTVAFITVSLQGAFQDMRLYTLVRSPSFILSLMTGIWSAKALSCLFDFNTGKLVTGMWLVYILSSLGILIYGAGFLSFDATLILFTIIQIGLLIKALIQKKQGSGIIATGFGVSVIAALFSTAVQYFSIQVNLILLQILTGVTYLAPALGISLYLAREFALKSSLLREKLVEVEKLSEQNIAQEQEKQQLLSLQNERLELLVDERTAELSSSLNELRATQTQLIQSEKMASLGELTAGIAHEIQNPLNFVNNFSEVSTELVGELEEGLGKGDMEEAMAIVGDIKQNLEKINHHGKRADSIVKGMLAHSRSSSGKKELTDINKLADEYMRLAFHGLRAKDKFFNTQLVTTYNNETNVANVVAQDIGRVLLNVFNNAFYAVQQKQKQAIAGYEPTVRLNIYREFNRLVIEVWDNGTGIPDSIKNKIMQPFFTTKPTGQGTGLGLSLSYDIVVKGHGGFLEIAGNGSEGTTATITLPV